MSDAKQSGEARRSAERFGKSAEILNVRAEIARRRGNTAAAIDWIGRTLSHAPFFLTLFALHALWIVLNVRTIAGLRPWDPYPFMLLAMIASVEAPFISLLILMRQHRDVRVDELREEIDLQVVLYIEREITVALRLLDELQQKLSVASRVDRQILSELQQPLDPEALLQRLKAHLDESEVEAEESA